MKKWKFRACAVLALLALVGAVSSPAVTAKSQRQSMHIGWAWADD
jgi:hypothetical protein